MICGDCKHFHHRPCQQSGKIQPHAIGWCVYGMEKPGMKKYFRQPAAHDGEQAQYPFRQHRCANWTEGGKDEPA